MAQHHQPPPAGSAARVTAVVYAANLLEHRLAAEPSVEELPAGEVETLQQLQVYERIPAWEDACRKIRLEEALRA